MSTPTSASPLICREWYSSPGLRYSRTITSPKAVYTNSPVSARKRLGSRLVNVAKNVKGEEEELSLHFPATNIETPLMGDSAEHTLGTADGAVSQSGTRVFFTARPAVASQQSVYVREEAGPGEMETINLSSPERCTSERRCEPAEEGLATFQGAAADGSKVFFTTEQELLPGRER